MGTSVFTWTYKSPKSPLLIKGIPLPFNLNCFPLWVPSGILIFALPPSIVGISIVVPRAASAIDIGNSKNKFSSDLLKSSWEWTLINKYKSPVAPPLLPASPLPANLIRVPSSTPFGIVTDIFLDACFLPWPLQSLHGFVISSPLPLHWGQVCWTVKKPWLDLTFPFPPQ